MKKLFYLACAFLILFEIANVYFIMPMPGSQEMNSIHLAYFLYSWRWWIRIPLGIIIGVTFYKTFLTSKLFTGISIFLVGIVVYFTNFEMAAEAMFLQTDHLQFRSIGENKVSTDRLIIGVIYKDQAKAYPIQFLGYHHQVRDILYDKKLMITYCTVCRTGRVYEPIVNQQKDQFRLVGMDHFNAMFEDHTTKSWWRQSTGEAIAGPLKGLVLPEYPSQQMTLGSWIALYPKTMIMQPDSFFQVEYDSLSNYEDGTRKGKLTGRDTTSWKNKSWVIGIDVDSVYKAYDWNQLKVDQIIHDEIHSIPIILVLSKDKNSFISFRNNAKLKYSINDQDILSDGQHTYLFSGKSLSDSVPDLIPIKSYQEYWHSWKTFHPSTLSMKK